VKEERESPTHGTEEKEEEKKEEQEEEVVVQSVGRKVRFQSGRSTQSCTFYRTYFVDLFQSCYALIGHLWRVRLCLHVCAHVCVCVCVCV